MTKEEKQLLLKDICGRLPYGVRYKGDCGWPINPYQHTTSLCNILNAEEPLVYLRPMSSMTDEERDEFRTVGGVMSHNVQNDTWAISAFAPEAYDWLNEHHFDYRIDPFTGKTLIESGLALKALEGMYKNLI